MISQMQRRIQMSFVTEELIIDLSPVLKQLEEKQHIEMANSVW